MPATAAVKNVYAADLRFVVDSDVLEPADPFVAGHAWETGGGASFRTNVVGDTVNVTFSGTTPMTLADGVLPTFAFQVKPRQPTGTPVSTPLLILSPAKEHQGGMWTGGGTDTLIRQRCTEAKGMTDKSVRPTSGRIHWPTEGSIMFALPRPARLP